MAATPQAALTFYWPALGRQVRIRGVVSGDRGAAGADFRSRSASARAVALLGRQSRGLADPGELDAGLAEAVAELARRPEAVPEGWMVFALEPRVVEFFQAQANRAHQRLQYTRRAGDWTRRRLWP